MQEQTKRGFFRADIHLHTTYSRAFMTPEELVDYVLSQTELRLIAITDHNSIQGGLDARAYLKKHKHRDGLDIIVGSEIKSADGHILGLFLEQDIPHLLSAAETIAAIHDQKGLAIAAHPFTHWLKRLGMNGLGSKIRHLSLDAVETRNSSFTEIYSNCITKTLNYYWQRLPETGGSDAYILPMVGKTYTLFEGETIQDFYQAITDGNIYAGGSVCGLLTMFDLLIKRPPVTRRSKT